MDLVTIACERDIQDLLLQAHSIDKFIEKLPFEAKKIAKINFPFKITREVVENILVKPKVDASFHHMYL